MKFSMLDHVQIQKLAGTTELFSGLDQRSKCLDTNHFDTFAHAISYCYNSRGFRDQEWPSDLTNAVWCVGDSFTTGLGSPFEHIWPQRLARRMHDRTVNVSMDGASNDWIARRVCDIYSAVRPRNIVIMWSYLHRREAEFAGTDQDRRLHQIDSTVEQDYRNLVQCQQQVRSHCVNSNIIELIIPNWQPAVTQQAWNNVRDHSWPISVNDLNSNHCGIVNELITVHKIDATVLAQQITLLHEYKILQDVIEVQQLDRARDGHHFDIVTADWVAEQIVDFLRL